MDRPSWHRVKEILDRALSRPPAERAACIGEMCGDNSDLRVEVESLLTAIDQAGTFIERPAVQSLSSVLPGGWIPDLGHRALDPGDSLGPYRILDFVGAGGMGEVYRAHDSNLNRNVALKVRPAAFALEADRFIRFRREAQILAALNHPNIAAIYGLEDAGGMQALVLELVEGPTVADRIARGRIPLHEALTIGRQIAEGLQAAHKRGIIHRDLKPANIKLCSDGTVKILDFGLAKALDTADAAPTVSDTTAGTNPAISHAGFILGTAAYMSPEQARGEAVDKRTDVWAFGCVLYEMLTGQPAFRGEAIQDVLVSVLNQEPDWSLLPLETPPSVVKVVRRCLEKDADRRLHDVADARIEIEDTRVPEIAVTSRTRRWPAIVAAGVAIALVGAVWVAQRLYRSTPESSPSVKRLQIRLPDAGPLARAWTMPLGLAQLSMAISPDGTRMVYVLERDHVSQLYLHELDKFEPSPMAGTEGGYGPFFSPDGRWIAFFAEHKLKKVSVSGGEPIELAAAPNAYGGDWGEDGTILFSPDEGRRPARIAETGGMPQALPVSSPGSFRRPDILPGGKVAIVSNPLLGVGVLSLETAEFRVLVADAGGGSYVPGYLVYARPGVLLAAPFDLETLALTGPESVVLEAVRTELEGRSPQPQAVFSRDGTLVYAHGGASKKSTTPVWVDRRGKARSLGMPARTYGTMSLSPDGRLLAIIIPDPTNDIWVQDLERGTLTRRTFGAEPDRVAWTPDGERIAFGSRRTGRGAFSIPKDGSTEPEKFVIGSFSPDGQFVANVSGGAGMGLDIWVHPVKGARAKEPFLRTRFTEVGPVFSPDSRWIAYVSDESGQYEVYVRPYPAREGKWQVSVNGGEEPVWSSDGKELFYRNGRKWMAAPVTIKPEFSAEKPKLLFEGPYANVGGQSYDVSLDGQRFLMLEPVEKEFAPVTHLNVVLNWFSEIQQRVPLK